MFLYQRIHFGFSFYLPKIQVLNTLKDLWIATLASVAVFLLVDLVFRLTGFKDQTAKDIAFIMLIAWIAVSLMILVMEFT